jgi:uncharacterized DUF497 family protein
MAKESITELALRTFDWDEQKNELNLAKHGIDFDGAIEVFNGPIILRRSDRNNEERWTALGLFGRSIDRRRICTTGGRHTDYLSAAREEK